MAKVGDLVVKTGEYTNASGDVKPRYLNVGTLMEGSNGQYILLNRAFNPAGVPNPDNKDSVIVSIYTDKKESPHQAAKSNGYQAQALDDEIPF